MNSKKAGGGLGTRLSNWCKCHSYNYPHMHNLFYIGHQKQSNLYSVQFFQNAGDYTEENVAAVCVSLHHPVYAEVCVNVLSLLNMRTSMT